MQDGRWKIEPPICITKTGDPSAVRRLPCRQDAGYVFSVVAARANERGLQSTEVRNTSRTARVNEPIWHRACLPAGRGPAGVEAEQMPRFKNRRGARGFRAMVIHDACSPNSQL